MTNVGESQRFKAIFSEFDVSCNSKSQDQY